MTEAMREPPIVVVALGGHAFMSSGEDAKVEVYEKRAAQISEQLMTLVGRNYNLVITHGNGPQVGNLLLKDEFAREKFPADPLDVLVARTQGDLGYILQQAMLNMLRRKQLGRYVVTNVTQVVVNTADPAFREPSKPIGPYFTEKEAKQRRKELDWEVVHQKKRGWRRLVPSPQPLKVIQWDTIRLTAKQGHVVIACGGGGIPVAKGTKGELEGVEAVVDKDLTSSVLATQIGAELLIILTDVPEVYLDFGGENQRGLTALTIQETEGYIRDGQFPKGSMGPKVQAILSFLKAGGKRGLITTPDRLQDALDGRSGTHFVGRI